MIFAGILGQSEKRYEIADKLQYFLKSRVKKDFLHIEKDFLSLWIVDKELNDATEQKNTITIGRIFKKNVYSPFSTIDLLSLEETKRASIFQDYWGAYICIGQNEASKKIEILRDPTGHIEFYYTRISPTEILFSSHIKIIYDFLEKKPLYNWDYIKLHLIKGLFSSHQTPFSDIFELPLGCILTIDKTSVDLTMGWNPLDFCQDEPPKNFTDKILTETLSRCMQTWTAPYKDITLSLSGGLDSTSLLFCLRKTLKQEQFFKAINSFHPEVKSTHEMEHAKNACRETNTDLIELKCSEFLPFSPVAPFSIQPNKIGTSLITAAMQKALLKKSLKEPSSLFISGVGGDFIFMYPPPILSVIDCFFKKGIIYAGKKLHELSVFYRKPWYQVFKDNFLNTGHFLIRSNDKHILEEFSLPSWLTYTLSKEEESMLLHPLYHHLLKSNIFPGKLLHIKSVFEAMSNTYADRVEGLDQPYYPMISQPFIELSLSIPSYELFANGYDRFPLRSSISKHFNTNLIWRRRKGNSTGVMQLGLKQNLEAILALCDDGKLVREGLVHKDKLKENLLNVANGEKKNIPMLMNFVSIELFFKEWM